jgi:hypothetical protein
MTRERAKELAPIISAYGEGKTIQVKGDEDKWYAVEKPAFDDYSEYRIKPEPRMRPMTRGEVLYKVTTTPGMVVRNESGRVEAAQFWHIDFIYIPGFEWAIIDASGNTGEWHKFEVEE